MSVKGTTGLECIYCEDRKVKMQTDERTGLAKLLGKLKQKINSDF